MIVDQLRIVGRDSFVIEGPDPSDAGWNTFRWRVSIWEEGEPYYQRRPRRRVVYSPPRGTAYGTLNTARDALADMRRMEEISLLGEPDYYSGRTTVRVKAR